MANVLQYNEVTRWTGLYYAYYSTYILPSRILNDILLYLYNVYFSIFPIPKFFLYFVCKIV